MQKHIYNSMRWILAACAASLVSCTEIVEIELDSTYKRLVVNASVTTDSVRHQVLLTTTSDYFSNEPAPGVTGAIVEIEFDDTRLLLEEQDTVPGLYLTPQAFRGQIGTSYHLYLSQIDIDGDGVTEDYQSSSTMPGGVDLDSINLKYSTTFFATGYEVYLFALDPPSRDWYSLKYWKNSDLLTDTLIKYSVQADEFYNGTYLFYGIPIGFFNDEDPREILEPGDTVTVELNSIEEDYYFFVVDAQLEIFGNNPLFSGPPANVRSNIDNGAMGIFTAYSINRTSTVVSK